MTEFIVTRLRGKFRVYWTGELSVPGRFLVDMQVWTTDIKRAKRFESKAAATLARQRHPCMIVSEVRTVVAPVLPP